MRILGVDQSYNSCGWVVIDDGEMTSFGIIKSDKYDDMFQRARHIAFQIYSIFANKECEKLHIEGLSFGATGNVTRDLAGLLFSIINVCWSFDVVPYKVIPPTSVKKFATDKGRASKEQMIESVPWKVMERFIAMGYKKTTGLSDLADAYFIGMYAE